MEYRPREHRQTYCMYNGLNNILQNPSIRNMSNHRQRGHYWVNFFNRLIMEIKLIYARSLFIRHFVCTHRKRLKQLVIKEVNLVHFYVISIYFCHVDKWCHQKRRLSLKYIHYWLLNWFEFKTVRIDWEMSFIDG